MRKCWAGARATPPAELPLAGLRGHRLHAQHPGVLLARIASGAAPCVEESAHWLLRGEAGLGSRLVVGGRGKDGGANAPQRDCGPDAVFHRQLAGPGGLGCVEGGRGAGEGCGRPLCGRRPCARREEASPKAGGRPGQSGTHLRKEGGQGCGGASGRGSGETCSRRERRPPGVGKEELPGGIAFLVGGRWVWPAGPMRAAAAPPAHAAPLADCTLYAGLDPVAEEQAQLFRCPEQDVPVLLPAPCPPLGGWLRPPSADPAPAVPSRSPAT